MSLALIDEFAIRAIGAVAMHGDKSHLRACREILCPFLRLLYGTQFCSLVGISGTSCLHKRYRSLSRFTPACPRAFVIVKLYDKTRVTVNLLKTRGRVRSTLHVYRTTRSAQLMLTAVPYRILAMPRDRNDKQSWLEVIDVDRVTYIRFLIWIGKQLSAKTDPGFLDVYQVGVLPRVLVQSKVSCKKHEVHDVPLAEVCLQVL